MKSILVIGLGRFGRHAAMRYKQLGNDVMAVDIDENIVNEVSPYVTAAHVGDCTNEALLKSLGVSNFDICLVAIGSSFQASLEITSLLKELGAPYVISKAGREIHEKFLLRNGADIVVYPEKEMGYHLAARTTSNNVFDFIELSPDVGIFEIPVHRSWVGKTILQLEVRKHFRMNILAIKRQDKTEAMPGPSYLFVGDEHLVVMGARKDVTKLANRITEE